MKQYKDEAEKTSAITSDHGTRSDTAAAERLDSNKLLDWRGRNGAAAARDSLRHVDTENEDATGKKYGGRALAQVISDMGMTVAIKGDEKTEEKTEEKPAEEKKGEEKKDAKEEVKEPESKEEKEDKEAAKKEDDKKKDEEAEEKKEEEKKKTKVINNAADRNQQIADNARKEAFDSVVSQEADEKDGVSTIQANNDKATAEAAAREKSGLEAYDYQRRGTAPAARDSLRFVDTENEGLNGNMYGNRTSLSQQGN